VWQPAGRLICPVLCSPQPRTQGWRFRAARPNMRPTEFWGIRRDALTEAQPTAEMAAVEEVRALVRALMLWSVGTLACSL